jgi:hypothetical protein
MMAGREYHGTLPVNVARMPMKSIFQRLLPAFALLSSIHTEAASPDWQAWDQLLSRHVNNGYVDYTAISQAPALSELAQAVAQAELDPLNQREKLVFYINAYNVLAVKGIIDGRSPASLLGRANFFRLSQYQIGGEKLSLYALEHDRIIPLQEPRIHFAIVCASQSCPILRSEAYNTLDLETQLDAAARHFLADSSKNRFVKTQRIAWISSIFKWFRGDFEQHSGTLQAYLAQYVSDPDVAKLLREEAFELRFLDYDWSLNGSFDP